MTKDKYCAFCGKELVGMYVKNFWSDFCSRECRAKSEKLQEDLNYWKFHEPQDVYPLNDAWELADKELRKYGMEADLWAFDINNIYEMQNDFYNIEFVGIDAYGRAFVISREDAEKYYAKYYLKQNKLVEKGDK
ncbi:hypothetical protein [Metamycoplasma hominis]|uniref:hypothetical protein n=1 Tax=Metamycoplasma hominis TaxID=2098 RepID=UPI00193C1CDA|nr:hypothetical protein [Metamycoplasma hominis]